MAAILAVVRRVRSAPPDLQRSRTLDSWPMCGIVGYVGARQAQGVVLDGLRRLEYRGYDSAGVAVVADSRLGVSKKAGKLANLEKAIAEEPLPTSTTGIGHTR